MNGLWSAADSGNTERVKDLLFNQNKDGNSRNCLGCTPLLYACGSGHLETVKVILDHPSVDINRSNNDRLTSFMLAMQGGNEGHGRNVREKMKRLMDLPATTDDLEWTRHDHWTALMEACNFGHRDIVEYLVSISNIDLEAINLRGQRAEDVALSRGHEEIADYIKNARLVKENPEELPEIQELEKKVSDLKTETRQRLLQNIAEKYELLREIKEEHEAEIEPLIIQIESLQSQLDEAMKKRMSMITKQVRKVKIVDEEIRQIKRKLDNFDRYASTGNLSDIHALKAHASGSNPDLSVFEKDFECSVCLEDMKPPIKIFQCLNGHVMCDTCKSHPEVITCPTCRVPLVGVNSLMRNLPMEKLARSYYNKLDGSPALVRKRLRDNDPYNSLNIVRSRIRKTND
uniref:E3 ubiquitin-protein ligase SINAT3 n=1 Tax=Lepeophtheirus salmonis TaxID=72036 RepID=C1BTL6_LEPSM|nr:E3 ubiquitin-protein ligase SINAT3 [Lepeophtheirus salmonis]